MSEILKIEKQELKNILNKYYPALSHKNATRIIRDIEINMAQEKNEEKL